MSQNTRAAALAALLVVSLIAGLPMASAAAPNGMVTIPDGQITEDVPSGDSIPLSASELEGGVQTTTHADSLEVVLTTESRAAELMGADGAVLSGDEMAIVLRDTEHSEGREVALDAGLLKQALGYAPEAIYGTTDDGETWTATAEYEDGYLVFDVPHFSSNTVTFSGEVSIDGNYTDGSTVSYQLSDLDSASDPSINLTGVTTSEWDNESWVNVADGDTLSLSLGGNTEPLGNSPDGQPTVELTGSPGDGDTEIAIVTNYNLEYADNSWSVTGTGESAYGAGGVGDIDGDGVAEIAYRDGNDNLKYTDTAGNTSDTGVQANSVGGVGDIDGDGDVDVAYRDANNNIKYVDSAGDVVDTGVDGTGVGGVGDIDGDGDLDIAYRASNTVKYVDSAGSSVATGIDSYGVGGVGDIDGDGDVDVAYEDTNDNLKYVDSAGNVVDTGAQVSNVGGVGDIDGDGSLEIAYAGTNDNLKHVDSAGNVVNTGVEVNVGVGGVGDVEGYPRDPKIDIDGDGVFEINHSGKLSGTKLFEISSIDMADESWSVSATSSSFDVSLYIKERRQSSDMAVELNGEVYQHQGTLADGETVQLTGNASALVEGTNTVNVSVGDGSLSADAPEPQVKLNYRHDATDRITTTYDGGKWTESYNVSKTFSSPRSTPTLSVPFTGEMYSLSNVEVSRNDGAWQSPADYRMDGTTAVIEFADVDAGDTVSVRATGRAFDAMNGDVTVINVTKPGDPLDSRLRVTSRGSGDLELSVGNASTAGRVHYTYEETWEAGASSNVYEAGGDHRLVVPEAPADSEFRVSTLPVTVEPQSGSVTVEAAGPQVSEPEIKVSPGQSSGNTVEYTYVNADSGTEYILWSVSDNVVRDSATASSPVTLVDDDSQETLRIEPDDSDSSSTDGDDIPILGPLPDGPQPAETVINFDFGNAQLLLFALAGLGVLGVLYWRGGTSAVTGAVTGSAGFASSTLTGTARWFATHPYISGTLGAIVAVGAVASGAVSLPVGGGTFLLVVGTPIGAYYVLVRRLGASRLIWGAVTAVSVLLGFQLLGTNVFGTLAQSQAFPILAIGIIYLLYQGIQTYRQESTTPEEQNTIVFETDGGNDGNGGGGQ